MKNVETLIKEAMSSTDSTQGLKQWAANNGATKQGTTDAVREVLTNAGYSGSIQDQWDAFLDGLGYTGDLTQKLRLFWLDGGNVGFDPLSLFAGGEEGAWYDPSDLSTLFQDAAGTVPVTADSDPVRLMLDKSKGGVGTNGDRAVNLLTNTEDFDNAVWTKRGVTVAKTATSPLGVANDAWVITENNTNSNPALYGTATLADVQRTFSVWLRVPSGTATIRISATSIAVSKSINLTTEWQRFDVTTVGNGISHIGGFSSIAQGSGLIIHAWHPQLELGATVSDYQPINAASWLATIPGNHATAPSDAARPLYKTAGGLHWLEFDGVDDSMSTAAINFAVTDAMSLFVGAEKSALTLGELIDTAYPSGEGKFFIRSGNATLGTAQWSSASRGTATPATGLIAVSAPSFGVGVKSAITAQFDISADQNILRVNGAPDGSAIANQGSGNFASTPIYLGARSATSLFFPGLLYQAVIRGAASSAQELADAEAHIAAKSGVTLP